MLGEAIADDDDLYWEAEKPAPAPTSPKRKRVQVDEESLDDTISTIKSGLSTKKTRKSAMKSTENGDRKPNLTNQQDSQTITSQATSISQLTEQVNEIKQTNKTFIARFDQLAEQMAALLAATQTQPNSQRPAGGHQGGSGRQP